MSTTNAALDWLISLSLLLLPALRFLILTPPDFTDWLQVSPTDELANIGAVGVVAAPSEHNLLFSNQSSARHSGSRVTLSLRSLWILKAPISARPQAVKSDRSARDATFYEGMFPASVQPLMFGEHQRMASLASSTCNAC